MKTRNYFILTLISITLLSNQLISQGWIITDSDGSISYFQNGWVKIEDPENSGINSIYHLESGKLIMIYDEEQTYAEGTVDDYCQIIKDMEQSMKESISDEQWAMMEEYMKKEQGSNAPEVTYAKKGSEEIAGYTADKYEIKVNGELYEEVWLCEEASLQDLINQLSNIGEITKSMVACSSFANIESDPSFSDTYIELMQRGFELKSVDYEYGTPDPGPEVISVEETDIDDDVFLPPDGYQQVSFSELLMMQSGM